MGMIVDFHVHLFETLEVFQKSWLDNLRAHLGCQDIEELETLFNGRFETLIHDMDEAGIDKSVSIPTSPSIVYGEEYPKVSIWRVNEYVAEAQSKYPDRIIGFVRVDPFRKDAIELLVKGVREWGLKGVKIHPTKPVTDELLQPVMSKIDELGVPVLIHMGVDPLPFLAENGNPISLDTLTDRFPKIRIIAAHHARGFEELLTAIISNRKGRIYSDLSAWQDEYFFSGWRFIMKMRYLMDRVPSYILMGSDWPFLKTPVSHKEWVDCFKKLKIPEQVLGLGLGIKDFSEEEKDMILGRNAMSLLGK